MGCGDQTFAQSAFIAFASKAGEADSGRKIDFAAFHVVGPNVEKALAHLRPALTAFIVLCSVMAALHLSIAASYVGMPSSVGVMTSA